MATQKFNYENVIISIPDFYTGEIEIYRVAYKTRKKAEKMSEGLKKLGWTCWVEKVPARDPADFYKIVVEK